MRIVAVGECLIRVLIHSHVVQAVAVGEIRIEREAVGCANPIGEESGVVVGLGHARPIEEVGKLRRRICGRTGLESRLNPVEHVPHALVGYITGKSCNHTGRTARLALADAASGQHRFEEWLRGDGRLGAYLLRQNVEGLSKALSASGHEERHLIQINALINVPGGVADVADLYTAASRQLALNGEVPLVMRTRLPLRIFHLRTGDEREWRWCPGASDHGGIDGREESGQDDGAPVDADTERVRRVGATIPSAVNTGGSGSGRSKAQ